MTDIRILIADDHEVVRKGLILVLYQEPGLEIVGEARTGREAVERAVALQPDLVLLDWKMPDMDGLAAAAAIRRQAPTVRTLLLSGAPIEDAALDALGMKGSTASCTKIPVRPIWLMPFALSLPGERFWVQR
jgi:two-component system, NarL family, response regulator LiaR